MKVYIASHSMRLAQDAMVKLVAAGHNVVSTWHDGSATPAPDDEIKWALKTIKNRRMIREADALILLSSPEHVARTKLVWGGKFVEVGYALGKQKLVYLIGGVENGALYDPDIVRFDTLEQLISGC